MAHVINDGCLMCGACAGTCPVGAISEGADKYVIDPDTCIDCGACISECPQEAITPEDDAEEKWIKYAQENAKNLPAA